MNPPGMDWRYRLRGDPTAWLLDYADNPSIYFWFQRDIVGRPEDSPALMDARQRILYSEPVQELYAAQDAAGFWEAPGSLDAPRYRATLWSLALLAELGVPRTSRRARAACEFVIQNYLEPNGAFKGLDDSPAAGLLVRALVYFIQGDARLGTALDRLNDQAAQGDVMSLWALAENRNIRHLPAVESGAENLLERLAGGPRQISLTFPPFNPDDDFVALRVLAQLGRANDPRAAPAIEATWERQQDGGRWMLDRSYNGLLGTRLEAAGVPSKWATLNVLRVVTRQAPKL